MTAAQLAPIDRAARFVEACWQAVLLADSNEAAVATADAYLIARKDLAALKQRESA